MPKYPKVTTRRGRFYYRFQYNQRRFELGGFDTAREAYEQGQKREQKLRSARIAPTSLTVEQLIVQYLEEHERVYNRVPTAVKNEGICRNHIIPRLGKKRLTDIRPIDMRKFQNHCIRDKTPAVAYNTMRTLKKIFNWAVEWEIMEYNPIRGKLPPEPRNEHPTLSPGQLAEVLEDLAPREKIVVSLGVFAGLRIGEIFGLKWEDIDFEKNTISIRRQFSSGIIGPLKTEGSSAVIPIWDRLSKMLKEWKLQCGSPEWLIPGKNPGMPLRPERWRQLQWGKIRKAHGLPSNLRFHDLRHSFATLLISAGADTGDIQKLMRHKSISITMDVYRHLLPQQLNRALEFFNEFCGEQNGERNTLSL